MIVTYTVIRPFTSDIVDDVNRYIWSFGIGDKIILKEEHVVTLECKSPKIKAIMSNGTNLVELPERFFEEYVTRD